MQDGDKISQLRNGFETYYNNVLQPKFAQMEIERKKYLRYFIWGLVMSFVILPLVCGVFFLVFLANRGVSVDIPAEAIFFALLVIIAIIASPLHIFKSKSKNSLMPELIKYFGDFHYEYECRIDDDTLEKSQLFNAYNRHSGDDYFSRTCRLRFPKKNFYTIPATANEVQQPPFLTALSLCCR